MRRKVAGVLCALGAVVFAVGAAGAGPAGAATEEERIPALGPATVPADACAASFAAGTFEKAASEGNVAPGQGMAVDVTWRPAWHPGDTVDVLGCVAANGHFIGGTVERAVANNGLWVHKFAVPANAANDARVCEASVVIGPGASGAPEAERSDPDCFTVGATAVKAEPAPAAADPGPAATEGKATTTPTTPAPAPAPTRSAAAASTPAPAPTRSAAAAAPASEPTAAGPPTQLPHTGARERMLLLYAGVLLVLGGWALAVRPTPAPAARPR